MARDIAIIEPDPEDWGWWVGYLLEQLEAEAGRKFKAKNIDSMLFTFRDSLIARIDKGKW